MWLEALQKDKDNDRCTLNVGHLSCQLIQSEFGDSVSYFFNISLETEVWILGSVLLIACWALWRPFLNSIAHYNFYPWNCRWLATLLSLSEWLAEDLFEPITIGSTGNYTNNNNTGNTELSLVSVYFAIQQIIIHQSDWYTCVYYTWSWVLLQNLHIHDNRGT